MEQKKRGRKQGTVGFIGVFRIIKKNGKTVETLVAEYPVKALPPSFDLKEGKYFLRSYTKRSEG